MAKNGSLFLRYNTGSGQDQRRITIDRIEMNIAALTNYAIDNGGSFPTGDQGLKALVEKPTTGPLPHNWRGPYVSDKRALRDAWDMPFHYVSPGDKRPEYDLWSNGADRAVSRCEFRGHAPWRRMARRRGPGNGERTARPHRDDDSASAA